MIVNKLSTADMMARIDSVTGGAGISGSSTRTWITNPCSEIPLNHTELSFSGHTVSEWEAIKKERDELKTFIETTMDKLIDDIKT